MPIKQGTDEQVIVNFARFAGHYIKHGTNTVYPYNFSFENETAEGIMGSGAWSIESIWNGACLNRTSNNPYVPGYIHQNQTNAAYPHDSITPKTPSSSFKNIYNPAAVAALSDFTHSSREYSLYFNAGYVQTVSVSGTIEARKSSVTVTTTVSGLVYVTNGTNTLGKNGVTSVTFSSASAVTTASTGNPVYISLSGSARSAYLTKATYNGTTTTLSIRLNALSSTSARNVGATIEYCYESVWSEDPEVDVSMTSTSVTFTFYNMGDVPQSVFFICEVGTSGFLNYYDPNGDPLDEEETGRWQNTTIIPVNGSFSFTISLWSDGYEDYCELEYIELEFYGSVNVNVQGHSISWLGEDCLYEY